MLDLSHQIKDQKIFLVLIFFLTNLIQINPIHHHSLIISLFPLFINLIISNNGFQEILLFFFVF
jgi:hypothetical protein